ncbi:MFS family permease [Polymorphobacter multimanifer]|uniref:MFS family permease n=1 Tax=Polymorphobacter multimanifer TaxID=1070431 RepID=A0A841LJV5_9SPHN|nr:MFS family permease [Polymorphobacter multimanifer]
MADGQAAAGGEGAETAKPGSAADMPPVGGAYAYYVLGVLVLVYVVNFVDRQILGILAEDLKADLGLTDADLGFLYGTAFAVFYALFGIPLGRLADNWVRVRLLSTGLFVWSGMTALSGLSTNFVQLSAARIGVGVGEASASPSAFSMLSDWFPREKRATALAIYSSGLYIGGGISLFIGAVVLQAWKDAYPVAGPFGLVGWQAAFLAVGLPGLLLSLWVATLKEPIRGRAEGLPEPPKVEGVWGKLAGDIASVIPPFTLINCALLGRRVFAINLAVLCGFAGLAFALGSVTGDWPQWIAICLGGYAVTSWAQSLKQRDAPTYALIWGTPAFVLMLVGAGTISFVGYSLGFWIVPYAIRTFVVPMAAVAAETGTEVPWFATTQMVALLVGGWGAAGGFLGVVIGGAVSDWFKKRNPSGRILVASLAVLVPAPFIWLMFTTDSLGMFLIFNIPLAFGSMYVGIAAATTQDLVLPRMRGAATATYFIGTTLIGLGFGPYVTGAVSKVTGSLATGVLALLLMAPVTLTCLYLVYRKLPRAEASRVARAQAAGEVI